MATPRKCQDWLNSYFGYARDGFCPDQFHLWSGISVIAAALERKVWVNIDQATIHPNLYVLLVSKPGVGKSTASGRAVNEFLRRLTNRSGMTSIRFLANLNNDASFIEQLVDWKEFDYGTLRYKHASGFLYASEASNSLRETMGGGGIKSHLTEFYDCPAHWAKRLVNKDRQVINGCVNMLACSTFSFLNDLVPKKEVDGGFASRLLYVLQRDIFTADTTWEKRQNDVSLHVKLLEDLAGIHKMTGEFTASPEFISNYLSWNKEQSLVRQGLASERLQGFMARKHTNVMKLCMVCSVSESPDLRLEMRHWERALSIYSEVEKNLPYIVEQALDNNEYKTVLFRVLKSIKDAGGELTQGGILRVTHRLGIPNTQVTPALAALLIEGALSMRGSSYKLLTNPEDYL